MRRAFICLLFFLYGCHKEKSCEDCVPAHRGTLGTVEYAGPPASDGCDWVIAIDGKHYHPDQLDNSFLQTSLQVELDFISTGDVYNCGFANTGIPVIHITYIKKK